MRKIILVAAMALTSAAVHAGELRSLSTAATPNDAPAAIQTKQLQAQNDAPAAKPADAPRYAPPPAETQTPAEPARNISDAPRTNARPAPVDNAPPVTASTEHPERRYDDKGYYDDAGYHPFPRRYAGAHPIPSPIVLPIALPSGRVAMPTGRTIAPFGARDASSPRCTATGFIGKRFSRRDYRRAASAATALSSDAPAVARRSFREFSHDISDVNWARPPASMRSTSESCGPPAPLLP